MIKFFRHIRKTLLNEGKTSKYLKYAIGEIVLVVIGILIALQINNWNIKRINDKAQTKLLKELLADSKSDSVFYNSRMHFLHRHINLVNNLNSIHNNSASDSLKNRITDELAVFDLTIAYQSSVVLNFRTKIDEIASDSIQGLLREYILQYHYIELAYEQKDRSFEKYAGSKLLEYSEQLFSLDSTNTLNDLYNTIDYDKHHKLINFLTGTVENSRLRTRILLNVNYELINNIEAVLNSK